MHSRATDRKSASKCQGKWPDQTLDQAFGSPEVLVAVSTSRLSCKRARKTRTLMPVWDSYGESRPKTQERSHATARLHHAARRRGGRLAARGTRAAGDTGGRVSQCQIARRICGGGGRVPQRHQRSWLHRRPECAHRVPLGGGSI